MPKKKPVPIIAVMKCPNCGLVQPKAPYCKGCRRPMERAA